jgi:hypothetical protein
MLGETIKQLIVILGGTTAGVVAIAFLARSIILHLLSKDIEAYKAKLKAHSDIEIERLKNELKMQSFEHETRFRKLHEKVADTISETYPLLNKTYMSIKSLVSPAEFGGEPNKEEKAKIAQENSREFIKYFLDHRIYYPKGLYKKIDDFYKLLVGSATTFTLAHRMNNPGGRSDIDKWHEAWRAIVEKAEPLFEEMNAEFQRILGFRE